MISIPAGLEGDIANPNVPQGDGYMSANVSLAGSVVVAGKTAEGSAIATTAPMGPNGEFIVHQFLYTAANPGSIIGAPVISSVNHAVTGNLSWAKSVQPAGTLPYLQGWPTAPLSLDVTGALFTPPVKPNNILGAKSEGTLPTGAFNFNDYVNATLTFFGNDGIPTSASATNPNLDSNNDRNTTLQGVRITFDSKVTTTTTKANPGQVTLTITASSGLFTGSFTLTDGTKRVVKYYGMVVPDLSTPATGDAIGAGYFVLPGLASGPTKVGRVKMLPIF
jgi:hypothetical protein